MTSLKSGFILVFMKKLTFYFLFSLFFITNIAAYQLILSNMKLGEKLTNYFTTAEISKHNINDITDLPFYSYDGKYSMVHFKKQDNIFKDEYDYIQITYSNKNDEIHYISAVVDFQFDNKEGLDECLNYKDKKVFEYKKQKTLKGLKKNITNLTHESSGTKENGIWFDNSLLKFRIGFICLTYPKSASIDNDFRLDYHTFEANDWLQEKKANN